MYVYYTQAELKATSNFLFKNSAVYFKHMFTNRQKKKKKIRENYINQCNHLRAQEFFMYVLSKMNCES